jgi:hypothetical protein
MKKSVKERIEFGDFQTPQELADLVCKKLVGLGISPRVVIEPTCGLGAFVEAAVHSFPNADRIIGVEVNKSYFAQLNKNIKKSIGSFRQIDLRLGDFFAFEWDKLLSKVDDPVLVLGNFPWVTSAGQGAIKGKNLPAKSNFQNHNGLDAITGKANFDISEWMLIRVVEWLRTRNGCLAMLCKKSVARKLLLHISKQGYALSQSAIYGIDAKKYFGASVDACLLYCQFNTESQNYDCEVYPDLNSEDFKKMGPREGLLIRDLDAFEQTRYLFKSGSLKWRSGVKHDCSEVMEFKRVGGILMNGLNEVVDVEEDYLYPLLKGSAIANAMVSSTNRYVLITQKFVGESTDEIKRNAPKTWAYLESHTKFFDKRKSQIYVNNPRFSIFGVGDYTFKPWKVSICGLYKSLNFNVIGPLNGKSVIFDDTVYFLGFDSELEANEMISYLNSQSVQNFLSSLIFWDEKRPVKTSILNNLKYVNLRMPQTANLFPVETY